MPFRSISSPTSPNETYVGIRTLPEPGQLVEVRRRRWVVDSVRGGALPVEGIGRKQHVVTLLSLEDDALGEELDVVWQVETDAQVLEKTGLPKISGCDSFEWTSAFLNAVRWGTATSTDRLQLQSPFRSGITIEDYQLEPFIPVSLKGIPDGKLFTMPPFSGTTWGKVLEGLEHPHTKKIRPITFDHDLVRNRDDIVLAHLNHRLVQKCLRLLREELWSLDDVKKLNRVSVRSVPDKDLSELAVAVWSRLVITGGNHHRIHEELTLSGGELKHRGFSRLDRIKQLEALVENGKHIASSEELFAVLKERFEANRESIIGAIDARSKERLQNLENTVARFKQGEIDDLNEILNDLEKTIKKKLDEQNDEGSEQLLFEGFAEEERQQYRKDMEALENRLKRIPQERIDETASIENRYGNLAPRTFPVAVVFLVPERMVRTG